MEMHNISYSKVFPLGGYSNEKIGVEIRLQPGENALDAFSEAKRMVERSHLFFKQLPQYERAKDIVTHPMDHTGRDVESARESIKAFEANFPEYLSRFPVSRQLNNVDNDSEWNHNDFSTED